MTRQEFILALRKELRKLPPEEIVEATQYYEEYFDDVLEALPVDGLTEEEARRLQEKTEADLIGELGSPKSIAAQIKSDYAARILEGDETVSGGKPAVSKLSAVWWVIIGICSAPVSIPLAIAIGCLAFAIITGALSIMIGIYSGIIGGAAGGIGLVIAGIAAVGTAASTGIMFIGGGLIAMACSAAAGVGAFIGTRELIRWIARQARNLNERRKRNRVRKMKGGASDEQWA